MGSGGASTGGRKALTVTKGKKGTFYRRMRDGLMEDTGTQYTLKSGRDTITVFIAKGQGGHGWNMTESVTGLALGGDSTKKELENQLKTLPKDKIKLVVDSVKAFKERERKDTAEYNRLKEMGTTEPAAVRFMREYEAKRRKYKRPDNV